MPNHRRKDSLFWKDSDSHSQPHSYMRDLAEDLYVNIFLVPLVHSVIMDKQDKRRSREDDNHGRPY